MVERFKIEGLKEVQAALRELPNATSKNIMRRVLLKRAEPVAEAAEARVAVRYGWLKGSINVSTRLTRRQKKRHKNGGPNDVEVFIGPGSDPAAHNQEFGNRYQPAQPFMRPAWDATKMGVLEGIKDDMWAEIEKAAQRLARKAARAAAKGK
jgi:HK97 gp10 family phage protein